MERPVRLALTRIGRRPGRDRSFLSAAAGRAVVALRSRLRLHVRISLCACRAEAAAGRGAGSRWSADPRTAGLRHALGGARGFEIRVDRGYLWRTPRLHDRGFPFRLQRASAPSAALLSNAWRKTLSREHWTAVYATTGHRGASRRRYRRRSARFLCAGPDAAP